jgi:hypothetical protein
MHAHPHIPWTTLKSLRRPHVGKIVPVFPSAHRLLSLLADLHALVTPYIRCSLLSTFYFLGIPYPNSPHRTLERYTEACRSTQEQSIISDIQGHTARVELYSSIASHSSRSSTPRQPKLNPYNNNTMASRFVENLEEVPISHPHLNVSLDDILAEEGRKRSSSQSSDSTETRRSGSSTAASPTSPTHESKIKRAFTLGSKKARRSS